MNNLSRPFSLNEAKIQAQILLKTISSSDQNLSQQAQKRLSNLQFYDLRRIQLKHTLAVIANEYGFSSWLNLKNYFSLTGLTKFNPNGGGFFNQWFSSYLDAKQMLQKTGGYLLPYKNQFFICESGYIEYLGLDKLASDWHNWIEPVDIDAWQRLNDLYVKGISHD
ncbi:MAG: hypothetical protein PHC75_07870 [Burkholderiales bacterium]|nr:hypothetical protein [Burkholderiales bacterium]